MLENALAPSAIKTIKFANNNAIHQQSKATILGQIQTNSHNRQAHIDRISGIVILLETA